MIQNPFLFVRTVLNCSSNPNPPSELSGPEGKLDLATINKSDYIARDYGRPVINKIADNNVFGVTDADLVAKDTTTALHYPGFSTAPAQKYM